MLLSVVCITFHDPIGFARTIRSISQLVLSGGNSVELIVVDGASAVQTRDTIREHLLHSKIIAEPDRGIYDAMNKGLRVALGDYVWFLNGGDESIVSWHDLKPKLIHENTVLLADYELAGRTRTIKRRSRRSSSMWHALPTSHQAIFYPRSMLPPEGYSEKFKVIGDYEMTARLYAAKVPFRRIHIPVARFHLDGLSAAHATTIAQEATVVQTEVLRVGALLRAISRCRHVASRLARRVLAGSRSLRP